MDYAIILPRSISTNFVSDEEIEIDLLRAVKHPVQDPLIKHVPALDGLRAIHFSRGSTVVTPYRMFMPKRFFRDFAITATVRPDDDVGGYLFALVNPFDTVVDLGVLLEPAGPRQTNVSLVYTDSRKETTSKALATFLLPRFTGQYTEIAIKAKGNEVILFLRCEKFAQQEVRRKPRQLQFDEANKLYIAQAGPILKQPFQVSLHFSNQNVRILRPHFVGSTEMCCED